MSYYSNLSSQERLNKICELLVRGIYLHAEEMGWIKKSTITLTSYPYKKTSQKNKPIASSDINKKIEEESISRKEFYSLSEAAQILKINKRTLQRWIKTGKVKVVRQKNGYQLINQKEIGYLIASNL